MSKDTSDNSLIARVCWINAEGKHRIPLDDHFKKYKIELVKKLIYT